MRRVGVDVDATQESSRPILSDVVRQEMATARVLGEESGNVVNMAGDDDQGTLEALLLNCKNTAISPCTYRNSCRDTHRSPS